MNKPIDILLETEAGYFVKCTHARVITGNCAQCFGLSLEELLQWRSGKRRILWRVRWHHQTFGDTFIDHESKKKAMSVLRSVEKVKASNAKLYKVTVKPKAK